MKFLISVFLTLAFVFSAHAQKQVEVTVTSTFLRAEPNAAAEKVQTVQKGERLALEKSRAVNGWYFVSTTNGTVKGWIRRDTVSAAENVAAAEPKTEAKVEKPKQIVVAKQKTPPASAVSKPMPAAETAPIDKIAPPEKVAPIAETAPLVNPQPSASPDANPVASAPPIATPIPAPVAAVLVAAPTPAPEPEEVIRVDTEEVGLNVRVVDANNRTVKNLNQAQFKVYEDGVLQTITSVSSAEAPMINALVIDNSRSLRSQLKSIIDAGKIIVGTNRPADETAVVRFVSADKIEVVRDFTSNKTLLSDGLENLFVEGGQTAVIDAVSFTAKKIEARQNSAGKDDIRLRALILISDGDDRSSVESEERLFDLLRRSQVQIYAVGFVDGLSATPDANGVNRHEKAKSFLTRLSEETGGRAFFPASIDELPRIAADLSAELHAQYLISYTPSNERRDGVFRRLKVEIEDGANREKRIAVVRAGRISANE